MEIFESPWFPWVASLVILVVGAPGLTLLGYLVYVAKTPKERRYPARFWSGTAFVLTMLYGASVMVFSGRLQAGRDSALDVVFVLTMWLVVPAAVSLATHRLLRRIGWGQPSPEADEKRTRVE